VLEIVTIGSDKKLKLWRVQLAIGGATTVSSSSWASAPGVAPQLSPSASSASASPFGPFATAASSSSSSSSSSLSAVPSSSALPSLPNTPQLLLKLVEIQGRFDMNYPVLLRRVHNTVFYTANDGIYAIGLRPPPPPLPSSSSLSVPSALSASVPAAVANRTAAPAPAPSGTEADRTTAPVAGAGAASTSLATVAIAATINGHAAAEGGPAPQPSAGFAAAAASGTGVDGVHVVINVGADVGVYPTPTYEAADEGHVREAGAVVMSGFVQDDGEEDARAHAHRAPAEYSSEHGAQ
jgi:hypothetical protein